MSIHIDLDSCSVCETVYDSDSLIWECPVCKVREEMQEQIDNLEELIRSFHPLE